MNLSCFKVWNNIIVFSSILVSSYIINNPYKKYGNSQKWHIIIRLLYQW